MTTATVLYNEFKDEAGRPAYAGRIVGDDLVYFAGTDPLAPVAVFEVPESPRHLTHEDRAGYVYRQMNRVDGDEYISTEDLQVRSMSVGDVVLLDDGTGSIFGVVALVCQPTGWERLSPVKANLLRLQTNSPHIS